MHYDINFFPHVKPEPADKERYYISQFDGNTYRIVHAIDNREICVCSNHGELKDAEERVKR